MKVIVEIVKKLGYQVPARPSEGALIQQIIKSDLRSIPLDNDTLLTLLKNHKHHPVFNHYRTQRPTDPIGFNGFDMKDVYYLAGVDLSGLDLSGATNIRLSTLPRAMLTGTRFDEATLNAWVNPPKSDALIIHSEITQRYPREAFNAYRAQNPNTRLALSADVSGINLSDYNFSSVDLQRVTGLEKAHGLERAKLAGATLSNEQLRVLAEKNQPILMAFLKQNPNLLDKVKEINVQVAAAEHGTRMAKANIQCTDNESAPFIPPLATSFTSSSMCR